MAYLEKITEHKLVGAILKDVTQFDLKNELKEEPSEYEYYIRNSAFYLTHFISLLDQLKNAVELLSNYDYSKNEEIGRGKHLVYNVENYIIRIASVSDRLLQLINAIFHLGINEKDVKERFVLNNMKVDITEIPQLYKEFKKTLNQNDGNRNAIVHRHSIVDKKLTQIEVFYHPELVKEYFEKTDSEEIEKFKLIRKNALSNLIKKTKTEFNNQIQNCAETIIPVFDLLEVRYKRMINTLE
tara:strand:+ start:4172 stop:4894 length:723 start_codon:yes stop_codon:yes gene_type:complete